MGHGKYIAPPAGKYQVQEGQTLELQFVVLPGESRDIDLSIDLCGPGAQAHVKALYLCKANEQVSFRIVVHHKAPACHSTQIINGIAGGCARVSFDGTIVVAPDAQRTEAYQENHNLLLSDSCLAKSLPQLEIYADDVACSHGATTGFLSAEEQFYMRSRGIPEAEARVLQMISFLAPVLARIADDAERERLSAEVEAAVRAL